MMQDDDYRDEQPAEELVRDCLSFMGYGNPEARIWFFEYEESMYDPSFYADCDTLADVLRHRRQYGEYIDFQRAWEELSEYSIERFASEYAYTWNYEAAFMLGAIGRTEVTKADIVSYAYEDAELGRSGGESFSCEARPLPKSDVEGVGPYAHVWPSTEAYHRDVLATRREQLERYLKGNNSVDWIVVAGERNPIMMLLHDEYGLDQVSSWTGAGSLRPWTLHDLRIDEEQSVNVIHAPFFGQGRTSYADAAAAGRQLVNRRS